jgi:hypothetical protein
LAPPEPDKVDRDYVAYTIRDANLLVRERSLRTARDNDEVEWQGGRVYLHLSARRADPPRG